MAKKFNKLVARVAALEKTIAKLFAGSTPQKARKAGKVKKAQRAVPARKTKVKKAKRAAAAKAPKHRRKARTVAPAQPRKAAARKPAKRKQRVPPPPPEQIVVSGAPEFATPLERM